MSLSDPLRPLVLASSSPNRFEVLQACGVHAHVHPADIDEQAHDTDTAVGLTLRLASEKCAAVLGRPIADLGDQAPLVVAADTVVEDGAKILGKPGSRDEAFQVLAALSGASHRVVTGVAVGLGARIETDVAVTSVTFRDLSDLEIDRYIDSGDYKGKAGSYGIQGMASTFVDHIEGSYHNVVGLPTHTLELLLGRFGHSLDDWRSR